MLYQPEVRLTSHPLASNITKPAPFSDIFPLKIALTHKKNEEATNYEYLTLNKKLTKSILFCIGIKVGLPLCGKSIHQKCVGEKDT
jgi:hypothetical protein